MNAEVQAAVREIEASSNGSAVDATDDGQGGAIVVVKEVALVGNLYDQDRTWVGFHITHTYPYADVYPHFVRPDLKRRDGRPLGEGTSLGNFQGTSAVQISRRSNRHNPATDTAALKLQKVIRWLTSR